MAKKLVYCLDDQLKEEALIVISKLLCVNDRELFEMCLDSLRSFDNEFGHSFLKNNPQIIQIAKARVKEMGVVGKVILEKFISTFDKRMNDERKIPAPDVILRKLRGTA